MGFWDIFRKKIEEAEIEKVKFNELQPWLRDKKEEIEKQEQEFLKAVEQRISQLIPDLKEKISVLKKIDVDGKKAEEKIKLIVKENLDNYTNYVDELVDKLNEITKAVKIKTGKKIVEKINSVFSDFKKRSSLSYEKATFLIGKEIGDIKEAIGIFFRDLENILKENKLLIDKSKIISEIETKIEKFFELEKIKSEIEKTINNYDKKINNLTNNIKIKEEEIEKIKKSEKFLEQNRKREEIEEKKQDLEKQINKLREVIDFKALANFYHSFEKEMAIIKEYKENFKQAFQKTKGNDLVLLLKESKLPHLEILNKMQEITEKEKEISSVIIEKTGIEILEDETKKIKSEIEILVSKKLTEEKRYKKLESSLSEISSLIKQELTKINVEVL